MICTKCGKEILIEESSFCAYCGNPFNGKSIDSNFLAGAGILAIIAGAFSAAIGTIGIYTYLSAVSYFSAQGGDVEAYTGFLLLGIFAIISAAFGLSGGMLSLSRNRFKISFFGIVLMLASALFTFGIVQVFGYGYTDVILLIEISIIIFSIIGASFLFRSRTEFK